MLESLSFRSLMERVRAGDQQSAGELVRQYEIELRRAVRVRLTDPRLRRVLDSADVCQSVLANFFVRVTAGQFDLERPEQLLSLLLRMVRNKIFDKVRRQHADKRDHRRIEQGSPVELDELPGNVHEPQRIVAGRDLLMQVRNLLAEDERHLADQRALGREWRDIAKELRTQPDALRKKLARGLDRVMTQLGLEGISDD